MSQTALRSRGESFEDPVLISRFYNFPFALIKFGRNIDK